MNDQLNQIPDGAPRQKSPARVAAGQRNGRLAAGKKSAAGKAASAQNAFKHGYNARAFSVLPTENREYFDNLAQSLLEELKPASPRQSLLAEQIIRYNWLLQRNFRLEEAGLTAEIVSQHNALLESQAAPDTQLATWFAVDTALKRNETLNNIYRHRSQIQRELARASKQFDDLKSKESANALSACHPPLPVFSDEMFRPEIEIPVQTQEPSHPPQKQKPNNEGNRHNGNGERNEAPPTRPPAQPSDFPSRE